MTLTQKTYLFQEDFDFLLQKFLIIINKKFYYYTPLRNIDEIKELLETIKSISFINNKTEFLRRCYDYQKIKRIALKKLSNKKIKI
ncbi:hypothetical protein PCK1_000730 [Pneumocystis canis]|nr:hypothetical protein PCK1_000730 [Pneumocystis canis]